MFFIKCPKTITKNKWSKPSLNLKLLIIIILFFFIPLLFYYLNDDKKLFALLGVREENIEVLIVETLPGYWLGQDSLKWEDLLQRLALAITGINSRNPSAILVNEFNLSLPEETKVLSYIPVNTIETEGGEEDFYLPGQDESLDNWIAIPQDEFPPVQLNGDPMVLIYNTHNAESYKPSDGSSRLEGKNGGVAAVSKTLAHTLEGKFAIKTVYCDVIHDYPDWTKSYINSMRTVQQLLKKYTKIQMVLDIHRDAGLNSRSDTLVRIGNKNYAKVMIVVGMEHPRWRENLAFAEKIEAKANQLYPGLIKCVRALKDRRYNQNLHPRALLMEFGSELNTREDANNSAIIMAEIIAETLKGK